MKENDIRHDLYKTLQKYGLWPIHGRDAIICQTCHRPVVSFEQGRPDLIVLNKTGPSIVIEVKAVNLERDKSLAFSHITPEQDRWLQAWTNEKPWGIGFLAVGTIEAKRRLWVIPYMDWKVDVFEAATLAGKKSVSMETLERIMPQYMLKKVTGGWEFPDDHPMWYCTPPIDLRKVEKK